MSSAGPHQKQQEQRSASLLLALPEPLLLAVLQCLAAAGDQRSLFSAARAHSRLHQAAVMALGSIAVEGIVQQQEVEGVLEYLGKHGQHVSSLNLSAECYPEPPMTLRQLPPTLQLHSLQLRNLEVRLGPGESRQGVLGCVGASALKRLRLDGCRLLDDEQELAAALAQLPALEHLSIRDWLLCIWPMSAQQPGGLQQLTHLELSGLGLLSADHARALLQPLQAMSRLADLRLHVTMDGYSTFPASTLSGTASLTRLELTAFRFEPGALAGKTQLQCLALHKCHAQGHADWTAELLSQLASLQRLTHLRLPYLTDTATPAAYSALTASSKLQHLFLLNCTLPAGVWQHMFPAGRQLPHLTALVLDGVRQAADGAYMAAPEGSRLVGCCPGLHYLDVRSLDSSTGGFAWMSGLSRLHTLVAGTWSSSVNALREVCQLTGLWELHMRVPMCEDGLLLQMTQLRQLTKLEYDGPHNGDSSYRAWTAQAAGDEPVWRQVLRLHLDHSDPAVAQAAAAALAVAD